MTRKNVTYKANHTLAEFERPVPGKGVGRELVRLRAHSSLSQALPSNPSLHAHRPERILQTPILEHSTTEEPRS
jgi:hypothetical protein